MCSSPLPSPPSSARSRTAALPDSRRRSLSRFLALTSMSLPHQNSTREQPPRPSHLYAPSPQVSCLILSLSLDWTSISPSCFQQPNILPSRLFQHQRTFA